jgi:hypothetical protein
MGLSSHTGRASPGKNTMFKLAEEHNAMEWNNGHFARYQGMPFNPNAPLEWREGWNQANRELTRPTWLA